jgi:hypothetical protein
MRNSMSVAIFRVFRLQSERDPPPPDTRDMLACRWGGGVTLTARALQYSEFSLTDSEATDEMVRVCHSEAMLLCCPLSLSLPSITETKSLLSHTRILVRV